MQLERTTIITGEDSAAVQLLTEALAEKEVLFVVVLGTGDNANEAAEAADIRAAVTVMGFKRKVIWIEEKQAFKKCFETDKPVTVGDSGFTIDELDKVAAISTSLEKVIKDMILESETIDFFRMETAYLEAGQ
jgi:hypothetical protein